MSNTRIIGSRGDRDVLLAEIAKLRDRLHRTSLLLIESSSRLLDEDTIVMEVPPWMQ